MIDRFSHFFPVLLCLLFIGSAETRADEPATNTKTEQQQAVERFVKDLSSPVRRTRIEAERALLQMGYAILPDLPASPDLPSASSREAVRRIRIHLERLEAEASVQPAFVAWTGETTLEAAVKMISEQTGNRLEWKGEPADGEKSFTPSVPTQPFWEAVAALERQFQLRAVAASERGLQLVPADQVDVPLWSGQSGIVRVSLRSVSLKPIPARDERLLRFEWQLQLEPRLRPLLMKLHIDDNTIATAEGQKLVPFTPGSVVELMLGQSHEPQQIRVDYLVPPGELPETLTAQLKFPMLIAAGSQDFEFPHALNGKQQTVRHGGAFVTLFPANFAFDRWVIPLRVVYDTGGPAFESHRNWYYQNEIQLTVGDSVFKPERQPQLTLGANGAIGLEYQFPEITGPVKEASLKYRMPTKLVDSVWEIEAKIDVSRELE